MSRRTMPPYSTKRRSMIPMNAEDSVAEFKRDRSRNVRPYVRSSTHKLKWTRELHQCFMRAVNRLGGNDKATPKRIVQHMDRDGITIAHVKSHLQMYRTGKINAEGMPNTVPFSVHGHDPAQFTSVSKELSGEHLGRFQKEAREVHMALQMLKEGRISGTISENFVELNGEYRPNSWSAPRLMKPFLDETRTGNAADAIDSLSGRKRKAEEEDVVELELSMATRSSSPKIQFPCPSTPEEASVNFSLGLS